MFASNHLIGFGSFSEEAAASKWNNADKGANIVLGNNDYDVLSKSGAASFESVRGTQSRSSGRLYFEIMMVAAGSNTGLCGFADNAAGLLTSFTGNISKSYGVRPGGTGSFSNGAGSQASTTGPTIATGGYWQFALDFTNSKFFLGVNNVWQNSGDPVAGTGAWIASLVAGTYFPAASEYGGDAQTIRLVTAAPFNGTVPAGFSAWG